MAHDIASLANYNVSWPSSSNPDSKRRDVAGVEERLWPSPRTVFPGPRPKSGLTFPNGRINLPSQGNRPDRD